jgi:hypothetical protein
MFILGSGEEAAEGEGCSMKSDPLLSLDSPIPACALACKPTPFATAPLPAAP